MEKNINKIIEKLSPLEQKIIPYLNLSLQEIQKNSLLDQTSLLRALQFLEIKKIIKIKKVSKRIIDLGVNGIYYKKNHLPERKLLLALDKEKILQLSEAKKITKLSDNEFKVSLGVLKNKVLIEIKNGKICFIASKEEITKKLLEEQFLDILPIEESELTEEQTYAYNNLKKRKDIVEVKEKSTIDFELSDLGKELAGKQIKIDLIEEITPEIIKNYSKNKRFRSYDVKSSVPAIYGGRRHFVNQAIEYGRRIWLDLGFKEMEGTKTQTAFWNFDALFTAQDHPVRDLHDTFFLKNKQGKLPKDKEIVNKVKQAHESGIAGSKGWNYKWEEKEAKRVVLRTHTTCLSAQTLASLDIKKDLPAKFFTIGKNFRNETVDWSHGFEFNQTEGIVIDENANLRHLIGYLKIFAEKMGYTKFRVQPAYFPYTEPSLEGAVWIEEKQTWMEVLAAGIFRPEVTVPLLGKAIPVLAWGPGFDRLMMFAYEIKDLRKLYENDIKDLRSKKIWIK